MSELFAAHIDDPLMHTSFLADLISEGGKFLTYALATAAVVAAVTVVVGAVVVSGGTAAVGIAAMYTAGAATIGCAGGVVVSAVASGAISGFLGDKIDGFWEGVVENFPKNPKGVITTGSENTQANDRKSARAAGSIPNEALLMQLYPDKYPPPEPEPEEELGFWERAGKIASGAWGFIKNTAKEFISPTATFADPNATPKDLDKVDCSKGFHGENFVAEGSKKVLINSQPASRKGDKSECGGEIEPKGKQNVRIWGDTATVRDVKKGKYPISQILTIASLVFGAIKFKGSGKAWGCFFLQMGVSTLISGLTRAAINVAKKPVHAATGAKYLGGDTEVDFTLPGVFPLTWQRFYCSLDTRTGVLGKGWSLPFDISIHFETSNNDPDDQEMIFTDWQGRHLNLGVIAKGEAVYITDEGFYVYYFPDVDFANPQILIETAEGESFLFEAENNQSPYQLIQLGDRNLNLIRLDYDHQGRVVQIHDEHKDLWLKLDYAHDINRLIRVRQISAEKNERVLVTYEYDKHHRLIQVSRGGTLVTRRFSYNPQGLMTMHEDGNGLRCFYEWQHYQEAPDPLTSWRVCRHWIKDDHDVLLEFYEFDYDLQNSCVKVIENDQVTAIHTWDKHYNITEYQNALGEIWSFQWDEFNLMAHTDPLGHTFRYTYDQRGNIANITDPLGRNSSTLWHDYWSFPIKETDFDGFETQYRYDKNGNLIKETDPEQGVTRYHYDERGLITAITNAKERTSRFRYNVQGLLLEEKDCSDQSTRYAYNEWGNLVSVTDAMGVTTYYDIDTLGRLLTIKRANGQIQHFEYDAGLNISRILDFAHREHHYAHNIRGQLVHYQNPQGKRTHFEYDLKGRLIALNNEKQERYAFKYDALDRIIEQIDLLGIRTTYAYNAQDELDHIIQQPVKGAEETAIRHDFSYDALGRLIKKVNHEDIITYGYQQQQTLLQRYTQEEWHLAEEAQREAKAYDILELGYNKLGWTTAEKGPTGDFIYQYDPLGNLLETVLPDGRKISHLYYGSGHLLQTNLVEGDTQKIVVEFERDRLHREVYRSQGTLKHYTRYDNLGRITVKMARQQALSDAFAPVIDKHFSYDKADQLVKRHVSYGIQDKPQQYGHVDYRQLTYDLRDQVLSQVTKYGTEQYQYDPAANLFDDHTVVQGNQLQQYKQLQFSYDGFGRLKTRQGHHGAEKQRFHYDSEHRLRKVELLNHAEIESVEFSYDVMGRRTEKIVHHKMDKPAETVHFWWSGMQMCGEWHETSGDSCLYLYNDQSYEPLARVTRLAGDPATDQLSYFHTHINGCPEELTDAAGQIIWRADYSLYGKTQDETDYEHRDMAQNIRFQGQYLDRETGLHYNTFRYYDPEVGRFTQQDPIGLLGGFNLYQYAANPLTWIDPWGLRKCSSSRKPKNTKTKSTGRTKANNKNEKFAMDHVKKHPENSYEIIKASDIGDRCFKGQGWSKFEQKVNGVTIHFMAKVSDGNMTQVTDFKFK